MLFASSASRRPGVVSGGDRREPDHHAARTVLLGAGVLRKGERDLVDPPSCRRRGAQYIPDVTVFLLSPARCGGERAALLVRSKRSALGCKLRDGQATIGEVFTWLSALYFRGKLTYARTFGEPRVMAPGIGLCTPDHVLSVAAFRAMGKREIETTAFTRLLRRDALELDRTLHPARVVLLGSIATGKYTAALLDVFGERLMFPATFVGRGDMSRGGLLLRAARESEELGYLPVAGATLHGVRPPKLPRVSS